MKAIASGLRNATRAGLTFPDSLYLMNVWDEGRCVRDDNSAGGAAAKTVRAIDTHTSIDLSCISFHGALRLPRHPSINPTPPVLSSFSLVLV